MFAAAEVRSVGRGGLAIVSKITWLARSTINRGRKDLDGEPLPKGRVRRTGGGRRAICEADPGLVPARKRLVEPATLGDPMRLRLLDLLLERGEATASALATELPITRQGIAKHLLVLERADLVQARRAGRETLFAIHDARLGQAQRQLAQIASRWDDRLATIKRIAEAAHKQSRAATAE